MVRPVTRPGDADRFAVVLFGFGVAVVGRLQQAEVVPIRREIRMIAAELLAGFCDRAAVQLFGFRESTADAQSFREVVPMQREQRVLRGRSSARRWR